MFKDHPDVYRFFNVGAEQKLLDDEILMFAGEHNIIKLLLHNINHTIILAVLINFNPCCKDN